MRRTHTQTNRRDKIDDKEEGKKGTTGTREDGRRYMGDGRNEEEGNPSSHGSSWAPPVIGWYPEDRRDGGLGFTWWT